MSYICKETEFSEGKSISLETGKLAKQAAGSAVVKMGDTVVLVTVCAGQEREGLDFFPLTVEYREKLYAGGRIPGGFPKRETRPSDKEILTCRIIDRPIRPMFPKGIKAEVQIVAQVLSSDERYDADTLAVCGASLAIGLSQFPFEQQVAAVRVALIDGQFIINPSSEKVETSDMEMVVAGSDTSICMVEGGAYEVSEQTVVEGIMKAHEAIKKIVAIQNEIIAQANPEKAEFPPAPVDEDLAKKVEDLVLEKLKSDLHIPMLKKAHYKAMGDLHASTQAALKEQFPERQGEIAAQIESIARREMREMILNEGVRIDGRKTDEVREILVENGLLPRTHGSALFQRGETQGLVTCTLGNRFDEQKIEGIHGETFKNYYLQYNFPPFCVGETGRMSGPGRREIGHGYLAERSLAPILPTHESFTYTIRLVSEILESHGSSSMASVCGGSLALMDAGVPVKTSVSGIAMGLISEGDRVQILSDINGTEDHLGDMDFKVAGTKDGITAFQMDIKIKGITPELMTKALEQAKAGRSYILGKMDEVLAKPNEISKHAPALLKKKISPDKIKDLIGPGGKVIRGIQEATGVKIDVDDNGEITVTGPRRGNAIAAVDMIDKIFEDVEVGTVYKGIVKNITNFGAFVEVIPGQEGLVHISELVPRGKRVEDVLSPGDTIEVVCSNVDAHGKIRLIPKNGPLVTE